MESFELQPYPFNHLPPLECHVATPLAVINTGLKCTGLDTDAIAPKYHHQWPNEAEQALKRRLDLVCEIWALLEDAKEGAKA